MSRSLQITLSICFGVVALIIGGFLVYNVKFTIDETKRIARNEKQIIKKLKMIRDAEIAYQSINGTYTDDWDDLIKFVKEGAIFIIQRKETIIPKEYGEEEVIVTFDTLGLVPVFDSLFTEKVVLPSFAVGKVERVLLKEGDEVKASDVVGEVKRANQKLTKVKVIKRIDAEVREGKIEKILVKPGDEIKSPDAPFAIIKYDRTKNVDELPFLPGKKEKKFEIYAGQIETKTKVKVNVFEVKDPSPINPARRKNNNETALKVGSRKEASTTGNWE